MEDSYRIFPLEDDSTELPLEKILRFQLSESDMVIEGEVALSANTSGARLTEEPTRATCSWAGRGELASSTSLLDIFQDSCRGSVELVERAMNRLSVSVPFNDPESSVPSLRSELDSTRLGKSPHLPSNIRNNKAIVHYFVDETIQDTDSEQNSSLSTKETKGSIYKRFSRAKKNLTATDNKKVEKWDVFIKPAVPKKAADESDNHEVSQSENSRGRRKLRRSDRLREKSVEVEIWPSAASDPLTRKPNLWTYLLKKSERKINYRIKPRRTKFSLSLNNLCESVKNISKTKNLVKRCKKLIQAVNLLIKNTKKRNLELLTNNTEAIVDCIKNLNIDTPLNIFALLIRLIPFDVQRRVFSLKGDFKLKGPIMISFSENGIEITQSKQISSRAIKRPTSTRPSSVDTPQMKLRKSQNLVMYD